MNFQHRDPAAPGTKLSRILGLGFGLAVIFGGTVGVGILRLPGTIAGQLGSPLLIMLVWVVGAGYALLGAISVAELGTAMPQAGGFYIYSKRAFGPLTGFAVGWADWLNNCAVIAYAAVAASEYAVTLFPRAANRQTLIVLAVLFLFCALHWIGLSLSSSIQQITSSITAITFLFLAAACLLHPGQTATTGPPIGLARGGTWLQMLVPLVAALRAIVVTYDGWYEAIYFTEEDTDVARHLPRAMIGGVVVVLGLYLLMNLAFLHVLPVAAQAARRGRRAHRFSRVERDVHYRALVVDFAEPDQRRVAGRAAHSAGDWPRRAFHRAGSARGRWRYSASGLVAFRRSGSSADRQRKV